MARNWKRKTERVLREYRDLQKLYEYALVRAEDEKARADALQTLVMVLGICLGSIIVLWFIAG